MNPRLFSLFPLLGLILILSTSPARAITSVNESFTATSGDWATGSNWSDGAAPNLSITNSGSVTNVAIITGGDTAIVDSSVPTLTDFVLGGTTGNGTIQIVAGGSMTNTGNSFVGRNNTGGITSTLLINGGSLTVQTELNIGGSNTTTNQSTATMTVTNGGTYSGGIQLGTTNSLSTGTLIISGTGNTIGAASGTDVFHMYTYSTLDFVLSGSGGVSELAYGSNAVTLTGTLDINVSNYTGGSETLNLINYGTLTGTFSNVAVIGTGASNYSVAFTNNAGTDMVEAILTETPVPEPETWALFFMGAIVLGMAVRRRGSLPIHS